MKTTYAAMAMALAVSLAGCSTANTDSMANSQDTRDSQPNTLNNNPNYPNNPRDIAQKQLNGLESQDRSFVAQASSGGAYEVQSSQLALSKSTDGDVKRIAQHMIDDHRRVNDQLAALAKDKGANVNTTPDADQQRDIDKLNGLSGAAFDTEYLKQQDRAHQATLVVFQQEDRLGRDMDLRNFAGKTLPTLGEHLRMVQSKEMGNTVGSDNP